MALRYCRECTTRFAVGLPACPHCQSTDHEEDGAMPKITRHGGPTIAGASVVAGAWSNSDEPDVWPNLGADEEGGEESSPGSSSETSPEKPPTSSETSGNATRKRAPGTGSRSKRSRTAGASSAPSTATGGQKTGASDGEDASA